MPPPTEAYEGDVMPLPAEDALATGAATLGGPEGPPEGVPDPSGPVSEAPTEVPPVDTRGGPDSGGEVPDPSREEPETLPPPWSPTPSPTGEGDAGSNRVGGGDPPTPEAGIPSRKALRTAFHRRHQQTTRSLAQAEALLIGFPGSGTRRTQRRGR
jgi:hypothetical protein